MGLVTDIKWQCPECGTANIAQLRGYHYPPHKQYGQLSRMSIPANSELKWNPPCEGCGKYRLVEPPEVLVEFPLERVENESGTSC